MLTIDSTILLNAISSVSSLAPDPNVILRSVNSELWLFSKSPSGIAAHLLPAPKMKDFFVIVEVESLKAAIQGRGEVTLSLKEEVLRIKAGSFNASLSPVEGLEEGLELPFLKGHKSKFKGEDSTWLTDAIKAVAVSPTLPTVLPLGIKITSKGSAVVCYDSYKISFIKSKSLVGDSTFVLPLPVVQSLMSIFGKGAFTLVVSESNVLAYNENIRFLTSLPQQDPNSLSISLDAVLERMNTKITDNLITFDSKELSLFLGSLRSIKSSESVSVDVTAEGSKVTLFVQTAKGKIKEVLKNSTPCDIKTAFNLLYLEDSIKKCKDTLKIAIEDNVALITTDRSKMIVGLDNV